MVSGPGGLPAYRHAKSEAKRRLAHAYNAAQERGEVQRHGGQGKRDVPQENIPSVTEIGLTHKQVHEAKVASLNVIREWLSGAGVRLAAWSDAWFQGPFAPRTLVHDYASLRRRSVASRGGSRERMQVQPKSEPQNQVMPVPRASTISP